MYGNLQGEIPYYLPTFTELVQHVVRWKETEYSMRYCLKSNNNTDMKVKLNKIVQNQNQDLSNTKGINQSQNTDNYLANVKYHLANLILKGEGL